jgi:hypothetical protein
MKIMTTAILAATLIATEFAYVAHEHEQAAQLEQAFKMMVFAQALRSAVPPAPQPHRQEFPGGAKQETL